MANVTFITGNENKAKYFAELLGAHIEHQAVDVPEIQSMNLREVVSSKAVSAYQAIGKPVIVEDTKLILKSLGNLPGPFIKWFLEEVGVEGLCRLADSSGDRSAIAGAAFAYYDGKSLEIFESELKGKISTEPCGEGGFGWNQIFMPDGSDLTLGEMDEETFKSYYIRIKPFDQVKGFLNQKTTS